MENSCYSIANDERSGRFDSSTGVFTSQLSSTGSQLNGSTQGSDTPPAKVIAPPPTLFELLDIPLDFIESHVRNGNEANLLRNIALTAKHLDIISDHIKEQVSDQNRLRRISSNIQYSGINASMMMNTMHANLDDCTRPQNSNTVTYLLQQYQLLLNKLKQYKQGLIPFMESNSTTAQEILIEGCDSLAKQKQELAEAEMVLIRHLSALLEDKIVPTRVVKVQTVEQEQKENTSSSTETPQNKDLPNRSSLLDSASPKPNIITTNEQKEQQMG